MNREQMYKKYQPALLEMYQETGKDNSVCLDRIICENNTRRGRMEREDTYSEIPGDFDFEEFEKDYQELISK